MPHFIEEAHRTLAGKTSNFRSQWNSVAMGENSIVVERPVIPLASVQNRINVSVPRSLPPYQKSPNKNRCAMCTMWFGKSSVSYEVSNHRLIALRKKWKSLKDGRRYECASYVYGLVYVCVFCAQLFDEGYDVKQSVEEVLLKEAEKETIIKTTLLRMNIAQNKKVYMSSVVDGMSADRAVASKVTTGSKSRREADPWWEIDLLSTHHIESVEFVINGGLQIEIPVAVLLLKRPVGFENPFLDSVKRDAVATVDYVLPSSRTIVPHTYKWTLPAKSYGRALRIQLKALYKLHILSVYIAQGDDFVPTTATDVEISKVSTAMAPPEFFKEAHRDFEKDMHVRPKTTSTTQKPSHSGEREKREMNILSLTKKMKFTYKELGKWKRMITEAADFFSLEELTTLRELVFLEACNSVGERKEDGGLDAHRTSPTGSRANTPAFENIRSADILSAPTPRCNFQEMQKRIRQILLWVNTGQQKKKLGSIYNSEYIRAVADDSESTLGNYLCTI